MNDASSMRKQECLTEQRMKFGEFEMPASMIGLVL
jgi:hypothetical protein